MEFTTPQSRARYLNQHPSQVHPGSAESHAQSCNLGIWGDRSALEEDCAAIMALEVNGFLLDEDRDFGFTRHKSTQVTGSEVASTQTFQQAFRGWRGHPEQQTQTFLSDACGRHMETGYAEGRGDPVTDSVPEQIARELGLVGHPPKKAKRAYKGSNA